MSVLPHARPVHETGRLACRALCQGAALHFVDRRSGVKDFDVWSYYAALGSGPFPHRRIGHADFGPSKFGRWSGDDPERFIGRRVDLIGRSLPVPIDVEPGAMLRFYLSQAGTSSARTLANKAVVLISLASRIGEVVWAVVPDRRRPCWSAGHVHRRGVFAAGRAPTAAAG
jgi:hypothetical protein